MTNTWEKVFKNGSIIFLMAPQILELQEHAMVKD